MTRAPANIRGFTLLEILIAVGLAMVLLGSATSGFIQLRRMSQRAQARIELARRAETLYLQLDQRLGNLMQHAAFVVDPRPVTIAGSANPTLRLAYMRGKEQQNDWDGTLASWDGENSDTYWEMWEFRPGEHRLYQTNSRRYWTFQASTWPGAAPSNLNGVSFKNFPRSRRVIDHLAWMANLEDNQLFPSLPRSAPISTSVASADDLGDWGMLQRDLRPVIDGVSDLAIEIVSFDGSVHAFSPGSAAVPLVVDGAWMDARSTDATGKEPGMSGWDYASSGIPDRPSLMRLRFTLSDTTTGLVQVFSFSFHLPSPSSQ